MSHRRRSIRLVHLFPDLLNVYGDAGNVRTLVHRAERRGVRVDLGEVRFGDTSRPAADLFLIGGGQDAEQATVARELERIGPWLRGSLDAGAALLAVCAGFQNLGRWIESPAGRLAGPGILPITTRLGVGPRLVGPVVADADASIAERGAEAAAAAGVAGAERTIVGFENHGGRTRLDPGGRPLARVVVGHGNDDGEDRAEGVLVGSDSTGLRIGTYLHGPLLPRNPHVADALIAAALASAGDDPGLAALDDGLEWHAHARFADRIRRAADGDRRLPGAIHRIVDPIRSLAPF